MNETLKEILLLLAGMGISLLTTFILWLVRFVDNKRNKLIINLRVMDKSQYRLTVKLKFINKSKETKYVDNINVLLDDGAKKLFQCEGQIDNYSLMRVEHDAEFDNTFSLAITSESIVEKVLSFDSAEDLNSYNDFNLWINNKTYLYKFNVNSHNWQLLKK